MQNTVAHTILAQLGGKRFLAMTGARDLIGSENSLYMRLPMGQAKHMRIELAPNDTYTVKTLRWNARKMAYTIAGISSGVYADNLQDVVEAMTGLMVAL